MVALKEERPRRSNPFIAELLDELYEIKVHPTTVRNILIEAGKYTCSRERRRPAIRFEAKSFGEIFTLNLPLLQVPSGERLHLLPMRNLKSFHL